jgi:hypothetical protein
LPYATDPSMGTSTYTSTYTAFSGCDIQAVLDGRILGNLMGISFSVTREKAPLYTLGSVDPRGFSRGKRGIAGSLIFTIFDRSALGRVIDKNGPTPAKYFARPTDVASPGDFSAITGNRIPREDTEALLADRGLGNSLRGGLLFTNDPRPVNYPDQIPPFDVVLSAQNEIGNRMKLEIYGVELLNEGSGVSVDD